MVKKLFAVYLGGNAKGANIEVHDIVFLASSDIDEENDRIKELWFGEQAGLHIDAVAMVEGVDNYKISIGGTENTTNDLKLFFINFGAASNGSLTEDHENGFFVASTKGEAIKKAMKTLLVDYSGVHLDNLYDIDDCIDVQQNLNGQIIIEEVPGFKTSIQNVYKKL